MRAYSMDLRERALLDSDAGMKAAVEGIHAAGGRSGRRAARPLPGGVYGPGDLCQDGRQELRSTLAR